MVRDRPTLCCHVVSHGARLPAVRRYAASSVPGRCANSVTAGASISSPIAVVAVRWYQCRRVQESAGISPYHHLRRADKTNIVIVYINYSVPRHSQIVGFVVRYDHIPLCIILLFIICVNNNKLIHATSAHHSICVRLLLSMISLTIKVIYS